MMQLNSGQLLQSGEVSETAEKTSDEKTRLLSDSDPFYGDIRRIKMQVVMPVGKGVKGQLEMATSNV